jgi:predicted CoA-binding protein
MVDQPTFTYSDELLRKVFADVHSIAVVGISRKGIRASNRVAAYLQEQGYRIFPVNPGAAGETMLGETVYRSLADIPSQVDMVDIFRRSEDVSPIVDQAIEIGAKVIWMQLEIFDLKAAEKAEAANVTVIMDRCPKIELPRLKAA